MKSIIFQDGKSCDRQDVYCELFIMTHCIVSLKHVSRFESKTEVEFDPICIDKNASKYSATISNQENVQGLLNKSIFTTKALNKIGAHSKSFIYF